MSLPVSAVLTIHPQAHTWKLQFPASALKKLQKRTMVVHAGAESYPMRVSLYSKEDSQSSIRTKVILKKNEGQVSLGPLVGILTVKRAPDFKGNKRNFRDIILTARRLGALVYVFSVEDIDWQTGTTKAYFYNENQQNWISAEGFPLPDVVYNRIPYRRDEARLTVQSALKRLQSMPGLHLFNSCFFNKWSLYQTLQKNPLVAGYVPETIKLETQADLKHMMSKHPLLYLKPISGKAGKGIMSLQTAQNGEFILKKRIAETLRTQRFKSLNSLWSHIRPALKTPYVIQQGIELPTYEGRPFDIRVLAQKNDSGSWSVSGVGIRVAGKNSITTHVPRGGSIASPEDVFRRLYTEESYHSLIRRLHQTVLGITSALDHEYRGLGELSMDIGLGRNGSFWFFEANAKPMKFDEPHIRKTSLESLILYSQYLSHFHLKGGGLGAGQTNHTGAASQGQAQTHPLSESSRG